MAELTRDGDELVLTLTKVEKAESLHGDIRVPVSSIRGVEVVEDLIHEVHGLKLPGTAWPGRFAIGRFVSRGATTFAVVHHATSRGVRVRLEGVNFDELLVGCESPEAVKSQIGEV
jgi:Bacterial PH domain